MKSSRAVSIHVILEKQVSTQGVPRFEYVLEVVVSRGLEFFFRTPLRVLLEQEESTSIFLMIGVYVLPWVGRWKD